MDAHIILAIYSSKLKVYITVNIQTRCWKIIRMLVPCHGKDIAVQRLRNLGCVWPMNKDRFKISYLKQYKSLWRVHRHSLTTLLYTPCKYSSGPRFAPITDLISECIDSTTCWKHFSEFLLHIKMLSCLGCRIVGCTTIIHVLFNNISKVLYWIVIWWHWRPLEYGEASLKWFELWACYPAGSSHQMMDKLSS